MQTRKLGIVDDLAKWRPLITRSIPSAHLVYYYRLVANDHGLNMGNVVLLG